MILVAFIAISCSIQKEQNKGYTTSTSFDYTTNFQTLKSVMVIPFELNGVTKNFLFDTGADFTLIQRDSTIGKTSNFSGASKRSMSLGHEIIKSLKIGPIDFRNTVALNGDLEGLKSQILNFGGLLGQPIINKAKWLIDYPNRTVQITSESLSDYNFEALEMKYKDGAPYTYIIINGLRQKVVIDFGSSSEFNLPEDSKLAKHLMAKYEFKDNIRERYTLGGIQKINEKIAIIPLIKLGSMEFKNVSTVINVSSQPRIGIGFFKDCQIYIDNSKESFKIKKSLR